jgi:hypothetical protein
VTDYIIVGSGNNNITSDAGDQGDGILPTALVEYPASSIQIKRLIEIFRSAGWEMDSDKLRSFRHIVNGVIELEPGGSDTTGHFLHHMKALS